MSTPAPVTEDERQRMRDMHAAGQSLTAISKALGRSKATVGKHCAAMGLQFDTSRTAPATEVKVASNRERRARSISRLYDRVDKIMDRLEADQFKAVGFSREGYAVVTPIDADAIPATDERALLGMAVNALNGAARLEAVDVSHNDRSEAKGMLGALMAGFQQSYAQLSHAGGTPAARLAERDASDPEDD